MVTDAIVEVTGIPEAQIDRNKTLIKNGADSLEAIELMNNLENKFDIQIADSDFLEKPITVDGIIDLVLRLLPSAVAVA